MELKILRSYSVLDLDFLLRNHILIVGYFIIIVVKYG
jgi:hypothetical protein